MHITIDWSIYRNTQTYAEQWNLNYHPFTSIYVSKVFCIYISNSYCCCYSKVYFQQKQSSLLDLGIIQLNMIWAGRNVSFFKKQGTCCHEFSTSGLQSGAFYANSQNFSAWYMLSFGRGSQIGFYMSTIEKRKLKRVSVLNVIDFFKGNGWHDALLQ